MRAAVLRRGISSLLEKTEYLTSCVFDLWTSIALDKGALVLTSKTDRSTGVISA